MSTTNKGKVNLKILIPIVLLIVTSIVVYIFIIQNKDVDEKNDSPIKTQQERISEIKKDLITLIPEKYEVIESEYEEPSEENDGCVSIYRIYPKEYSEIEKEYLATASLIYCEDINTAVLESQVGQVSYNQEEDRWLYIDGETRIPQENMTFGTKIVTFAEPFGSHYAWDAYIVKVEKTDELIILLVPGSNRIRCETYENGVETMKEECVDFMSSMGMPSDDYGDWVPDEIYENYYKNLLEILKDI